MEGSAQAPVLLERVQGRALGSWRGTHLTLRCFQPWQGEKWGDTMRPSHERTQGPAGDRVPSRELQLPAAEGLRGKDMIWVE